MMPEVLAICHHECRFADLLISARLVDTKFLFMQTRLFFSLVLSIISAFSSTQAATSVGAAKVDVTPDYPIRMGGYAVRRTRSEGIEQRIWAKALAISSGDDKPVVYITLDSVCKLCSLLHSIKTHPCGGWLRSRGFALVL